MPKHLRKTIHGEHLTPTKKIGMCIFSKASFILYQSKEIAFNRILGYVTFHHKGKIFHLIIVGIIKVLVVIVIFFLPLVGWSMSVI